jgi:arginyl-tRNA synthetase
MKEILEKEIEKILIDLGAKDLSVGVTPSVYLDKGDYTTSVAMVHAKELGKNPIELAEEIKKELENKDKIRAKELENVSKNRSGKTWIYQFLFVSRIFCNSKHRTRRKII